MDFTMFPAEIQTKRSRIAFFDKESWKKRCKFVYNMVCDTETSMVNYIRISVKYVSNHADMVYYMEIMMETMK